MPRKKISQDPHAAREAERYDNPVASREMILQTLQELGRPLTREQLAQHFGLFDPEREEALRRRLIAMSRDGQLISNRRGAYQPITETELLRGRVQANKDGYGYFIPDDGSEDLILSSREMRQLFDGDIIQVRVSGFDHKGRREAAVVKVEVRRYQHLVGRYREDNGLGYLLPDNPRITQELVVQPGGLSASPDQFVVLEITQYPTARELGMGKIIEVLGDFMAPGMEIDIALRNYDIPHVWPAAVQAEASQLSPVVDEQDKCSPGRQDIRHLPLITIDGEDAKDFDDAVFAQRRRGGGYRLVVAIADVSHYVRPDSALDTEARARGNSVYFPGFVVPMLPEVLSNGLCSLNPHVDRLCMVCDMTFSRAGRMTSHSFYPGVMHSQARTTYTQVAQFLEQPESSEALALAERWSTPVQESIYVLYELYTLLRKVREARGALDFDSGETRIIFSEDRKIERIVPVVRNNAHKLIEEMMLAANVATAEFVLQAKVPALYRNHEGPRNEKLLRLRDTLAAMGLRFSASAKPRPADFFEVIQQIATRPDKHVIETLLLRSLSQAVYAPENLGHFGLAYEAYTHFTSPIRRYPDLLIHRAVKAALLQGNQERAPAPDVGMMAHGEHCSMTERRADEATRDVMAWLKCEYMQDHIGDSFDGVIAAVTPFGFFVELKEVYVEGLVHVSQLRDDYYQFDSAFHRLVGERTGRRYAIGEPVRVKVASVNLDERKIDFDLISGGSVGKRSLRERLRQGEIPAEAAAHPKRGAGKVAAAKAGQKTDSKPAKKAGPPSAKKRGKAAARRKK